MQDMEIQEMDSTLKKPPSKAYQNLDFLNSKNARVVRILSEYLEPESRLKWQRVEDTIVFFGSARALPLEVSERSLNDLRRQLSQESGRNKPGSIPLERGRTRYDQIVWSLLILPVPLCMLVAPVTAAAAFVLSLWKWRAPPSLVANTRLRFILGMVMALIELGASALIWGGMFLRR